MGTTGHKSNRVIFVTLGVVGLTALVLILAISQFFKTQPFGFLNLDALPKREVQGEKNATSIDACDHIVNTMCRITGRKWSRNNSMLNFDRKNALAANAIRVLNASRPLFSGKSWYRITVDDGVLIEAATEQGFQNAAEHFAELIQFESERPRIAKGEYTARNRKKTLTQEETASLNAVRSDADKVTITGVVRLPNGQPAANVIVDIRDYCILRNSYGGITYCSGCAVSIPGGHLCQTDANGRFEFEAIPGCILIVGVYRNPVDEHLVSDMICTTPSYHSNPPLDLRLRDGIPVTVRVQHDDGTPAEKVQVSWMRPFKPPVDTHGDSNIDNNCNAQASVTVQDGTATFYFVPGEYELNVKSNSYLAFDAPKTITVVEGGQYAFDYTIPKPVTVQLLYVNGEPLANHRIKLLHAGNNPQPHVEAGDITTDDEGKATVYLWSEANFVFAISEEDRFGIIASLSHNDVGKTVDVTLETMTTIIWYITAEDTHLPVANKELPCEISITTLGPVLGPSVVPHHISRLVNVNTFKTDNEGRVHFRLPPLPPPEGNATVEYAPLLGHTLTVPSVSAMSWHIAVQGDFSDYRPILGLSDEDDASSRTVEMRGRVTYPNGTPGKNMHLRIARQSKSGGIMSIMETNDEGGYSVNVPEDGFFAAWVEQRQRQTRISKADYSSEFASPVLSVYVGKKSPDVIERDIVLKEGIPLRGRLTYENGEPAVGKYVWVNAYPFGRKPIMFDQGGGARAGGSINVTTGCESDENGEYVVFLTPGKYVVSHPDQFGDEREREITIRPDDEECVLDFVISAETDLTAP